MVRTLVCDDVVFCFRAEPSSRGSPDCPRLFLFRLDTGILYDLKASLSIFQTYLFHYLSPYKGQVLLMGMGLLLHTALSLYGPQLLRDFIDGVAGDATTRSLASLAILYLIVRLGRLGGEGLTEYLGENVAWAATNNIRVDLLRHAITLDMEFFNTHPPGTMLERTDGDANQLAKFFSQFSLRFLRSILLVVGIGIVMAFEDWRICLVIVGFIGVMAGLMIKLRTFGVPYNERLREMAGKLYGLMEERLTNMEDIKALGGITYSLRQMETYIQRQIRHGRLAFSLGGLVWPCTLFTTGLGSGFMLAWGGYLFLNGQMTIGTIYLMYAYMNLMLWPIEELSHQMEELQKAGGSLVRIEELRRKKTRLHYGPWTDIGPSPVSVRFQQVHFCYADDSELVLKNIDFVLEPGHTLGIAGRTGSGKTTIGRLLARMYDPDQGQILLNNRNLQEFNQETLRRKVGVVTQNVQFFSGTLRDNLHLFEEHYTDSQLEDALGELNLLPWLATQPQGLNTLMSSASLDLSTGEAQRLALARIFLRDPEVVILDEAVASLDPATEEEVEEALQKLLRGRTSVVIAHKMKSLEKVDEILILDRGVVLEYGTRQDLLALPQSRLNHLIAQGSE